MAERNPGAGRGSNCFLAKGAGVTQRTTCDAASPAGLVVCRENKTGDIVAVSTAVKMAPPRLLNNVVYYYRHFVAEAVRRKHIGTDLVIASRQHLNQQFVSGVDVSENGFLRLPKALF